MKSKKEKVSKLFEEKIYCRTLLAIALLKSESKGEYLNKILDIPNLPDFDRERWNYVNETYKRNGDILIADITRIFGFQRVNRELIDALVDADIDDEVNKYFEYYESILKYFDLYEAFGKTRVKLLDEGVLDLKIIAEKLSKTTKPRNTLVDTLSKLEDIYNEELDKTKISTCIEKIDGLNASFRKGTVNAVMGYTGSYKTLYCTNVSYDAIKNGLNVCYVSLEISRSEMYYNFLSRYSNENIFDRRLCHTDMKFKELTEDNKNYLFRTIVPSFYKELSKHLSIIDESDFETNNSTTFDNLFRIVESSFVEKTGKGVDLVVIDHLNLLKFSDSNGMNDYSKVNHWMSYFRRNCKNFIKKHKQVCILVAVQCSREGYERAKNNGGSYSLTGAAEGNEIERSSENVLAIYSDSNLKEQLQAKIQIIKGRNCGEMNEPLVISVNPKYYIVSDYDETKDTKENEIIDVSVVNKQTNIATNEKSKSTMLTLPVTVISEPQKSIITNTETKTLLLSEEINDKVADKWDDDIAFVSLNEKESQLNNKKLDISLERQEQLELLGVNLKNI